MIALLGACQIAHEATDAPSAFYVPLSHHARFCDHVDTVVIGTVTARESYQETPTSYLDSRITFDVERVVRGAPSDPLRFVIGGGELDGAVSTDSWYPSMPPGSRRALFLYTRDVEDPVFTDYRHLDPASFLPPEALLIAAHSASCAGWPVPWFADGALR